MMRGGGVDVGVWVCGCGGGGEMAGGGVRGGERDGGHLVPRDEADARESVEEVTDNVAVEGRRAAAHRGAVGTKRRAEHLGADAAEHGERGVAERLRVGDRAVGRLLRRGTGRG